MLFEFAPSVADDNIVHIINLYPEHAAGQNFFNCTRKLN